MTSTKKAAAPVAEDRPALSGAMALYADPRPVTADTHRHHAILPGPDDYTFAAEATLVPVTVDEFAAAAVHYPIVFFGPERRAFVVTGLVAGRNLFVDADGTYAAGVYIPAYLRRYPFAVARDTDDRLRILCLDEASPRVGVAGSAQARALFDGEQPTELTRNAMTFCQEMESAERRTEMLATMLEEAGLLVTRHVHEHADGAASLMLAYAGVDAANLAALDDARFAALRRAGALPAIYAQLLSTANWGTLKARADADRQAPIDRGADHDPARIGLLPVSA